MAHCSLRDSRDSVDMEMRKYPELGSVTPDAGAVGTRHGEQLSPARLPRACPKTDER